MKIKNIVNTLFGLWWTYWAIQAFMGNISELTPVFIGCGFICAAFNFFNFVIFGK